MNFKATDPNIMISETGRQLLEQLRSVSGATNEAFQQSYVPLLYRLAQFVQNLPLDKISHSEPRGAFRFGVTSALLTMRMADGVLFSTSFGGEMMSKLNPQFRLAAFAASLATVPLLVHHNIQIMLGDTDWSYLEAGPTLYDRLKDGDDCTIKWKSPAKPPVSALGTVLLAQFFDPGIWAHLHPIVFEEMCVAINPSGVQATVETQLSKIVRLGHEKARLIDESARTPLYSAPVAPLSTLDAIAHAMLAPVPAAVPATVVSSHVAAPVVAAQAPPLPPLGEVAATYPPEFMEWLAAIKNSPEHYWAILFTRLSTTINL